MVDQLDQWGAFELQAGGSPLYQQIADQLTARIQTGAYPAGYRLPPTRVLAKHLQTHRNTVVRAYELLEEQGLVSSAVGRGTFVEALVGPDRTGGLLWGALLSSAAKSEPLARFDRLARNLAEGDLVNLSRHQPSEDLLPHELLDRCLGAATDALGGAALGYAPRDGVVRLRERIAERLRRRGVPAQTDDVIVTTGSQQALDLLARALLDPGDRVLVEGATYYGALNVFSANSGKIVGVPSDDEGPQLDALDRLASPGAKILYLMPNCHNPTGVTMSAPRRNQLLEVARRHGIAVIEDDFAAELELDDEPLPPSMRSLDGEVIVVGTFSKMLIPALRVGYLVCPPALRTRLVPLKHAMDLGTSALLQHALAELIERGELDRHLDHVRAQYRLRRDALEEGLSEHLPDGFTWRHPVRGLTLWIPLPAELHPERVFDEAQRGGVLVNPSSLGSVGSVSPHGIRLTYCAEGPDRLREGARRLGASLEKLVSQTHRTSSSKSLGVA